DIGAAISGGMGLATGANINPERRYPSMIEPVNGTAQDIAGQGKANPLAAIWSVSQMLDFFQEEVWGKRVLATIKEMLTNHEQLTPDLGGTATTKEVGDRFVDLLQTNVRKSR